MSTNNRFVVIHTGKDALHLSRYVGHNLTDRARLDVDEETTVEGIKEVIDYFRKYGYNEETPEEVA